MEDKRDILSQENTDKNGINDESLEVESLLDGISVSEESAGVILENKEQSSLEALLYDNEDNFSEEKILADSANYEASLAEYHNLMHKAMTISSEVQEDGDAPDEEIKADDDRNADEDRVDESEFLISLPENKAGKVPHPNTEERQRNEISLIPEEYIDEDPDSVFVSEEALIDGENDESVQGAPEVEEPAVREDEDFQLSFTFDDNSISAVAEEEEDKGSYNPQRMRIVDYAFEFVEILTFTLAVVIICTSFLFNHSVVDGGSMLPTLVNGDHLIISDLFYTPERGDIIVFEDYSTHLRKAVIKRVVGLPGDVVEIKAINPGTYAILVNGNKFEEYQRKGDSYDDYHTGKWVVAEGELFVLGDNHYDSTDSRHGGVGTISIDSVLGKVLFRFSPIDKFGRIE